MRLKTVVPFTRVSMPGQAKDPTHWWREACSGLHTSVKNLTARVTVPTPCNVDDVGHVITCRSEW
jgi:hypothetical protein